MTSKPFGVNITLLPSINPPDYEGYARAAVEEGIRIIETAGNNREHHPSWTIITVHEGSVAMTSGTAHQVFQG